MPPHIEEPLRDTTDSAMGEQNSPKSSYAQPVKGIEDRVTDQPYIMPPMDANRVITKRKKRRQKPACRRGSTHIERTENNAVMQQYEYLKLIGEGAYAEVRAGRRFSYIRVLRPRRLLMVLIW